MPPRADVLDILYGPSSVPISGSDGGGCGGPSKDSPASS